MANSLECRSKRLTPFADIGAKRGPGEVSLECAWPEDEARGARGACEPLVSDGKAAARVAEDMPHIFDELS
jgi:hypothetical protein